MAIACYCSCFGRLLAEERTATCGVANSGEKQKKGPQNSSTTTVMLTIHRNIHTLAGPSGPSKLLDVKPRTRTLRSDF
eukprot:2034538-Alexandrium_andersonii.AAC.1